ncbi:MAG: ABC transporter ATP-binding protein [Clostridiales Family XIII bacterium]|nr:ABC transporter ATP-binding protein [Clostridiales Family XIII bacterium]
MNEIVRVEKLTKRYGDLIAVDGLSFEVREGEIFGFLGPNGAGKTTTLNIITTLADFDQGRVTIAGYDLVRDAREIKALIGLVPQEIAVYRELTAQENVSFFASLYGLKGRELKDAVGDALAFVGLADAAKKRAGKMSGGMLRRLNIACGIAHQPKLIVMDEPTVGVDARSRDHIMSSIRVLRERGATIIYTSHYMPEVQDIADRIAIIDKGRLVAVGTENELLEYVTDFRTIELDVAGKDGEALRASAAALGAMPGVRRAVYAEEAGMIRVDVDLNISDITPVLRPILESGIRVSGVRTEAPDLETTFLALTGGALNEEVVL